MVEIVIPQIIVITVAMVWVIERVINICNNLNKLRRKK